MVMSLCTPWSRIVRDLVHFLLHRSTTTPTSNCYLQDLFTLETERGKGVGRALIEAVYQYAKQAGCNRVYWQTHETMKRR
jgi:GNAT superfamily N-acetyltransferase